MDTLIQPFDEDGNLLCVACHTLIKRFYVVVNERDDDSVYPSQLVVHTSCLHLLADIPPGVARWRAQETLDVTGSSGSNKQPSRRSRST